MSTKTVALNTDVYARLRSIKQDGESFSSAIDRLITEVGESHSGSDILRRLATLDELSEDDAGRFFEVVAENRRDDFAG